MNVEKIADQSGKESSDPKRTVLSLGIVKMICDSSGFKLGYKYESSLHTFKIGL